MVRVVCDIGGPATPSAPDPAKDVPVPMAYALLLSTPELGSFMMYDAYQGMADVGDRVRQLAQNAHAILVAWSAHPTASPWRRMSAYYELVALAGFTHARPDYGIESVEINGAAIPVEERGALWTPFRSEER